MYVSFSCDQHFEPRQFCVDLMSKHSLSFKLFSPKMGQMCISKNGNVKYGNGTCRLWAATLP